MLWRLLWEFALLYLLAATKRLYKLELPTMTFLECLRNEKALDKGIWNECFCTQLKSNNNHMTRFSYALKTFEMNFSPIHSLTFSFKQIFKSCRRDLKWLQQYCLMLNKILTKQLHVRHGSIESCHWSPVRWNSRWLSTHPGSMSTHVLQHSPLIRTWDDVEQVSAGQVLYWHSRAPRCNQGNK